MKGVESRLPCATAGAQGMAEQSVDTKHWQLTSEQCTRELPNSNMVAWPVRRRTLPGNHPRGMGTFTVGSYPSTCAATVHPMS